MKNVSLVLDRLERAAFGLVAAIKLARESNRNAEKEYRGCKVLNDSVVQIRAQIKDLVRDPSYDDERDKKSRADLVQQLENCEELAAVYAQEGSKAQSCHTFAMMAVAVKQRKIASVPLPAYATRRWKPDADYYLESGKC